MKTKTEQRFRQSFDIWLRDGVWGFGNARLDSPVHENRPHIEANIGGDLTVRATALADESTPIGEHDVRLLAALACGDVRRCSIYLSVYRLSDCVAICGPVERGVIAIPSEMDAAAEALLDDFGTDRVLEVVRSEIRVRELKLDGLRKSLTFFGAAR